MLARVPDVEDRLYAALGESFNVENRTGTHLSSLLNPLRTYWEHRIGRPPISRQEIGYFSSGRAFEDVIARLLVSDFESTPEEEVDGIHLRPDFIAKSDRIIPAGSHAEFKSRRANLPKSDEAAQTVFDSYRAQIRGYMALKRQSEMYLIVLSLMEGKTKDALSTSAPVIAVYKETMTSEELGLERHELVGRKILLEAGISDQLPLCWSWLCGKWTKVIVEKTATWVYLPRCPYYADCKPQLRDPKRGMKQT